MGSDAHAQKAHQEKIRAKADYIKQGCNNSEILQAIINGEQADTATDALMAHWYEMEKTNAII